MKTLALTLAASLIASTSAFAGLFDVNDAPINYSVEKVQMLDTEATASIEGAASDYNPNINAALFDVTDQ